MIRIIVVGSEKWKDINAVWRELEPHWREHKPKVLVAFPQEGMLSDLVNVLCKEAGIDRVAFPLNAKSSDDPESRRFRIMIRMVQPDLVLAFHPFMKNSKVTRQAVAIAESHGIETRIVSN